MAAKTEIGWTDSTWSPLRARVKPNAAEIAREKGYTSLIQIAAKMAGHVGPHCEHCSSGCDNCYAETNNHRCLPANGTGLPFDRRSRDLVDPIIDEKILAQPLRWKHGRRIFVENQSDLFGEWVTDAMIDRVFAVMALCPQHTFQVLTKRAKRMREYFRHPKIRIEDAASAVAGKEIRISATWPLPNVWMGVSAEDQQRADERIPDLLATPASVRFVSVEPLLGPVDLTSTPIAFRPDRENCRERYDALRGRDRREHLRTDGTWNHRRVDDPDGNPVFSTSCGSRLDWVIVGGESGPDARPMHPAWARSIRDQCLEANTPFFFKQWGEYGPAYFRSRYAPASSQEPRSAYPWGGGTYSPRLGKKTAGHLLDGVEWQQFPEAHCGQGALARLVEGK